MHVIKRMLALIFLIYNILFIKINILVLFYEFLHLKNLM